MLRPYCNQMDMLCCGRTVIRWTCCVYSICTIVFICVEEELQHRAMYIDTVITIRDSDYYKSRYSDYYKIQ